MDDEEQKGFTWEGGYTEGLNIRDLLEEDDCGSIEKSIERLVFEAKRKARLEDRPQKVRLGVIRYVYIVIDCSSAMLEKSLMPSRFAVTSKMLNEFTNKFSEQNPISQIGIITCADKRAERLISLTGNVRAVKEALDTVSETSCHGEFSLHNCLDLAMTSLQSYPGNASREIILITASLSTCDPFNIYGTIELLKRNKIRCSVVSLSAEVFVFKKLTLLTSGSFGVVLDESHYELLMNEHSNPPITPNQVGSSIVRMGFPVHERIEMSSFCQCHRKCLRPSTGRGYFCPQCGARYCTIPVECRVCKLVLISAPQLARSFQNLIPLPAFKEVAANNGTCFGCFRSLDESNFACKKCESVFCIDCDVLLHDSVQICPGCKPECN